MFSFNSMKEIPKAAVRAAAVKALEEIESSHPDAIQHHSIEVCEIFSQAIKRRSREIPEARRAASEALMEKLRRAAEEQSQKVTKV